MNPEDFAYDEFKDLAVYKELLKIETSKDFRDILKSLIEHEENHYNFWLLLSSKKNFSVNKFEVWFYKIIRKILGLTFTAKLLELHEKDSINEYKQFLKVAPKQLQQEIEKIIEHEEEDERKIIAQIKEGQVEFMSSIILGLNDGLIELTGALVGFSFAFVNHNMVALTGLITGIAASMSMAASSYMQARHEEGKDAKKSATYTGISYITVVLILVSPFLIFSNIYMSLGLMFIFIVLILVSISYYTSVLFDRKFTSQFLEMFMFSMIVAFVSFLIGFSLKNITGITV